MRRRCSEGYELNGTYLFSTVFIFHQGMLVCPVSYTLHQRDTAAASMQHQSCVSSVSCTSSQPSTAALPVPVLSVPRPTKSTSPRSRRSRRTWSTRGVSRRCRRRSNSRRPARVGPALPPPRVPTDAASTTTPATPPVTRAPTPTKLPLHCRRAWVGRFGWWWVFSSFFSLPFLFFFVYIIALNGNFSVRNLG